jgi:outer membrane immunogenic protein
MKFNPAMAWALVLACAPQAAFAADLMTRMPAPVAPPAMATTYDWSGAYVGGQVGYGWGRSNAGPPSFYQFPSGDYYATGIAGFGLNTAGAIGGVEAGYGWQSHGLYVGIEADASASGIKGSYTDDVNKFSVDSTLQWLSTARVRVGLPIDRILLFASGGVAVGGVRGDLHDFYNAGTINSSSSSTNVGWTIGAGAAVALSQRWTVKAEYLYADLGSQKYDFVEPTGPDWSHIATSAHTTASVARVALDYRF